MAHRIFSIDPGYVPNLSLQTDDPEVDISFFVPCYNEEKNVEGALKTLEQACSQLSLKYEILVFDDCSADQTVQVVSDYMAANPDTPISLFTNSKNQGVARNFFEGAFRAQGKHYRLVCGDDVEPLESHVKLLAQMEAADIIVPYYTSIGGRSSRRHAISETYTRLVNLVSGNSLKYYNGCPIYKRMDTIRFHVETTGFGYQAEFLTRLLHENRSFVEIPLVSIDREGSASLNLRNFISVMHSLLKIGLRRLRANIFK